MPDSNQRVLSIGQCGVDHGSLARLFQSEFGLPVDGASTLREAERLLQTGSYALILVNRKLDLDGSSGLAVLQNLIDQHPGVPAMLVSNYPDAQQQAIELGAAPGFGKAQLHQPETLSRIRMALERT